MAPLLHLSVQFDKPQHERTALSSQLLALLVNCLRAFEFDSSTSALSPQHRVIVQRPTRQLCSSHLRLDHQIPRFTKLEWSWATFNRISWET